MSEFIFVPINTSPLKVTSPVSVPPASGSLVAIEFVTVVLKLASSPKAAASSFNVFSAPGAESTMLAIPVVTKAVVASCVVLVPADAVGAAGVPVKVGPAIFAFKAKASNTAFCDGAIAVVPLLMASATLASV